MTINENMFIPGIRLEETQVINLFDLLSKARIKQRSKFIYFFKNLLLIEMIPFSYK